MKIGIIGYGKMGKAIEKIALTRGHSIEFKVNDCKTSLIKDVDIAIDFSTPESSFNNIYKCIESNTAVISGTTGWLDKLEQIKKICEEKNGSFLYASNFSLGANIFFELNKKLARIMSDNNTYKVSIDEMHHIHKLDKPSGTAITIAEDIIVNSKHKNWQLNSKTNAGINIKSIREKEINGIHEVKYKSDNDLISIKHEAFSRDGFALGAIIAAEWLVNKKGFYTVSDMLNLG
jgi:4-hydroxy-tetrahydrodipicolinate reductase